MNGYNRIIESSPIFISLSNHKVSKRFLDFKRWKKNYEWCRIAPNGLIWSINFQNFCGGSMFLDPHQKGLRPSALITSFQPFCSWSLIFSLFKWSVPTPARDIGFLLASCVCVFFSWTVDIPTPLYCEGGLFFLPAAYLSFATDKIWERGEEEICDIIQNFFS